MSSDIGITAIQTGVLAPGLSGAGAPGNSGSAPRAQEPGVPATPAILPSRTYADSLAQHEQSNRIAVATRHADQTLERVGHYVGRMKAALEGITKQYPPYPAGSQDRKRYLESFAALRRQIQALVLPPDNKWLGIPSYASRTSADGASPVPNAADQLGLPQLAANSASDGAVQAAVEHLGTAAAVIADRRSQLAAMVGVPAQADAPDPASAPSLGRDGRAQIAAAVVSISLERDTLVAVVSGNNFR